MEISIQLLGSFAIQIDQQPLNTAHIARLHLLLAYLALHSRRSIPRAEAAFQLWPDSSEKQALTNLRKLLHHLRQGSPQELQLLKTDTRQLQLPQAEGTRVDLIDFEAALETASRLRSQNLPVPELRVLQQAITLYAGDLLPACYEEWLVIAREQLRKKFLHAADRLMVLLEQRRYYGEAIQVAERRLHAEPLSEDAYRNLIRLHALNGDRAAALGAYHTCAERLSMQLGVEPDETTRQLYKQLFHKVDLPECPVTPISHPLVGRDEEWSELMAAWQQAKAGGVHLHILRGEAGIGKTRLAEEFLLWAKRQGLPTASAACYESGMEISFAPLVEWLRARPLHRLSAHQRREIARILPELLAEDDVAPGPIHESWQQIGFFDTLRHALLGGEPSLILLLDDVQWCDRDTLEWLKYFICSRPTTTILILSTLLEGEGAEPKAFKSLYDFLRPLERLSESSLPRLDAKYTTVLATSICGNEISETMLFRESEGVPLFIVEMARSVLDVGRASGAGSMEFSPRLQSALARRLERLNEPARLLAQAIAVLGIEFNLQLISKVAGMPELEAMLALDELWQRRIVRETGSGKYNFSHQRLGVAALLDLSPVRRRWLHLQAARTLEQNAAEDGLIARHYVEAGEATLAAQAFSRAARRAAGLFALEEARSLIDQALALEIRSGPEIHELHGEILGLMGLLHPASEAYGRALVACQTADWQAQARLHRRVLNCLSRVDYDSARNAYQQGSADLLKAPHKDASYWGEWLELHLSWLRANYWVANADEVGRVIHLLDEPLKSWGTRQQKIQHRHGILLHHLLNHQFTATAQQVAIARQNVAAAGELNSPFQLAEQLSSLGLIAFMAGEFDECIQAYNSCLEVAEAYHLLNLLERAYAYLSLAYRLKKQPDQTAGALDHLKGVLEQTDTHTYQSLEKAQSAWLAWRSGDGAAARQAATQAIKGWDEQKIKYPLEWAGRMVLLALATQAVDLTRAAEQARALFQPPQQRLSPAVAAALQIALDSGGQGTLECWQKVVVTAESEGYL